MFSNLIKLLNDYVRHPNVFSKQVVQNLYDVSGAYPIIRVGGSTQNSAVYYPNQSEAIIAPFSATDADQPSHSFIGPAFMESFQQLPRGTRYIYGMHDYNGNRQIVRLTDANHYRTELLQAGERIAL